MSYPPQPGYPVPSPGYGPYRPPGPNNTPAFLAAGAFLICGVLALIVAIVGWSSSENPDLAVALIGLAFSDDLTGNADFAISFTMSVACTTLTFALVLLARLDWVRWLLGFVGALVSVYYLYAIIWVIGNDGADLVAMVIVSFLLWTAATVVVLLPHTARAMRGYQRKLAQQPYLYPQQQYPPGGYRPY